MNTRFLSTAAFAILWMGGCRTFDNDEPPETTPPLADPDDQDSGDAVDDSEEAAPTPPSGVVEVDEDGEVVVMLGRAEGATYEILQPPTRGELTGDGDERLYTPDPDVFGTDRFTYRATGDDVSRQPIEIAIVIQPVNDAPVAYDDALTVTADRITPITLRAYDADQDPLQFEIVTPPSHGILEGTAPNLRYVSAGLDPIDDAFTWTVSDGSLTSDVATMSLTAVVGNEPPVASPLVITTEEDTPHTFRLGGTDAEDDPLVFYVAQDPVRGALSAVLSDGTVTYTPLPDEHGEDELWYFVADGQSASPVARVSFDVTPVNDPPVASAQAISTDEDIPIEIVPTGEDVDGDELTFTLTVDEAWGSVSTEQPFTFTPAQHVSGTAEILVVAFDGELSSEPVSIDVDIQPVNDPPVGQSTQHNGLIGDTLQFTLAGFDVEDDPLTYAVVSPPDIGTLSGTPPELSFDAPADWSGETTLTYVVQDATSSSDEHQVTLRIQQANAAPSLDNLNTSTLEDEDTLLQLNASDPDGGLVTVEVVTEPTLGSLTEVNGVWRYSPDPDVTGTDAFEMRAFDGIAYSIPATITIDIQPINDAPRVLTTQIIMREDTPTTVTLDVEDIEGDPFSISLPGPTPSELTIDATQIPQLSITPASNFHGVLWLPVEAQDTLGATTTTTIEVEIRSENDAPVANPLSVVIQENSTYIGTLDGYDADADPVLYTITEQPTYGTLDASALPSYEYTPPANWTGTDTISYTVSDGLLTSEPAQLTFSVTAGNIPPTVSSEIVVVTEDTEVDHLVQATDVDGDPLTLTITTPPLHGEAILTGRLITYTPDLNFFGIDTLELVADDGSATSDVATLTFQVVGQNDPPVATNQMVAVQQDQSLSITLLAEDPDGDTLTYAITALPSQGTLSSTPPWVYEPNEGYVGPDSFTFSATDPTGEEATATVSITVTNTDDPPTLQIDPVVTEEDTPYDLVLVADDPDGDPILISFEQPENGTISGSYPSFVYTPNLNYNGDDLFSATATAGGQSVQVDVAVTVTPVNDPPDVYDGEVFVLAEEELSFSLLASDPEDDPFTFIYDSLPPGVITGNSNPIQYIAPAEDGEYTLTWRATDGQATSESRDLTIWVLRPPEPQPDHYTSPGNVPLEVTATEGLLSNDELGDLTREQIAAVGEQRSTTLGGTVTISAQGAFSYTPPLGVGFATDSFSYTLTDLSWGTLHTSTVEIDLGPRVWFADSSAPAALALGTLTQPFADLTSMASAAGDNDVLVIDGYFTESISLQSGQRLWGSEDDLVIGSTLVKPGTGYPAGIHNDIGATVVMTDDTVLQGVRITGAATGVQASQVDNVTIQASYIETSSAVGIDMTTVELLDIQDVLIIGPDTGIQVRQNSRAVTIQGVSIQDIAHTGIRISQASQVTLEDNDLQSIGTDIQLGRVSPIGADSTEPHGIAAVGLQGEVQIRNNSLDPVWGNGIGVYLFPDDTMRDVTVSGNTIIKDLFTSGLERGIALTYTNNSLTPNSDLQSSISENTIVVHTTGIAVTHQGTQSGIAEPAVGITCNAVTAGDKGIAVSVSGAQSVSVYSASNQVIGASGTYGIHAETRDTATLQLVSSGDMAEQFSAGLLLDAINVSDIDAYIDEISLDATLGAKLRSRNRATLGLDMRYSMLTGDNGTALAVELQGRTTPSVGQAMLLWPQNNTFDGLITFEDDSVNDDYVAIGGITTAAEVDAQTIEAVFGTWLNTDPQLGPVSVNLDTWDADPIQVNVISAVTTTPSAPPPRPTCDATATAP